MAEDRQVTPEKQLLKLIEDPGTAVKGPAVQKERIKRTGRSLLSPAVLRGALSGWLSFFRRTGQKRAYRGKFALSFKAVNRLLALASFLLIIYLAADTFAQAISLMHPPNFVMQKKDKPLPPPGEEPALREEAAYLEKASARNLFKEYRPAQKKAERAVSTAAAGPSSAMQGLTLVGISWSSNPDAIVEDKENQKTYFLKRGTTFGDGMKVASIFKDRVVVSYNDEEFEIK